MLNLKRSKVGLRRAQVKAVFSLSAFCASVCTTPESLGGVGLYNLAPTSPAPATQICRALQRAPWKPFRMCKKNSSRDVFLFLYKSVVTVAAARTQEENNKGTRWQTESLPLQNSKVNMVTFLSRTETSKQSKHCAFCHEREMQTGQRKGPSGWKAAWSESTQSR